MSKFTFTGIISLLLLCGCHWPGVDTKPVIERVPYTSSAPKLPPTPTVPPEAMAIRQKAKTVPAPPSGADLPPFRYAFDPCAYRLTLQGSSNLVDWVDLIHYGPGCPTNYADVTNNLPYYFFRMKGNQAPSP